jgi:DNA replication and repair protein RecF
MKYSSEIDKVFISKIFLSNYRNFLTFEREFDRRPILIIGENGTGKTNILESISLMSPGRGLRNAKFDEICRKSGNKKDNAISDITISTYIGDSSFRSVFDHSLHKRMLEFNGARIPTKDLTQFMSITWITPEMHHIFTGARANRLKFFDRIVYSFFPLQASLINKYEYLLHERRLLLKSSKRDEEWLSIIEKNLSQIAFNILANRRKVLENINSISQNSKFHFPRIQLRLESEFDDLQCEENEMVALFMERYKSYRKNDLESGKSNFGPHKTELIAIHLEENIIANNGSMGQQKAILVSIILSQILALIDITKRLPIVLLDEVFAHLDRKRSIALSEFLVELDVQVWVTDTEKDHIDFFSNSVNLINL